MYGEFAQVYDRLMDDVDYDAWAAHYAHLMGLCARPVRRVAECACGTGSLTVRLARMGYEMTGLDLSQAMLERAAEKARHAGVRVTLARQDMRGLTLGRRVDAVLCTCDGVNYLTGEGDAAAFFRAASVSATAAAVTAGSAGGRLPVTAATFAAASDGETPNTFSTSFRPSPAPH